MSDEIYAFALKNTLNEIENACPSISHSFIFKDTKILASDEDTTEETINKAVNAFNAVLENANVIGGIESATFHSDNGQVRITQTGDFYLTTVTTRATDERQVNIFAQVLIPMVLKLIAKIQPEPAKENPIATEDTEPAVDNIAQDFEKEFAAEEDIATQTGPELLLPKPLVNQLMVTTLRGLRAPSDTVRIGNAVIMQWENLYTGRKIEEVEVEALNGKTTRCKFKPIKDFKYEGKGLIQMPERIKLTLQTQRGELVMVKPVIE